jgi:hypothetical protein
LGFFSTRRERPSRPEPQFGFESIAVVAAALGMHLLVLMAGRYVAPPGWEPVGGTEYRIHRLTN